MAMIAMSTHVSEIRREGTLAARKQSKAGLLESDPNVLCQEPAGFAEPRSSD
jgi:hypothetical protein